MKAFNPKILSFFVVIFILLFLIACSPAEQSKDLVDVNEFLEEENPSEKIQEKDQEVLEEKKETSDENLFVVDSYQDKCYGEINQIVCPKAGESFFGQDAQYLTKKPSYKDNGDNTISDLRTGLMWTKKAGEKIEYDEAKETYSFAGYDDWRIPTIKELYSLMDFRGIDPDSQGTDSSSLTPFINTDYFEFEYGDVSSGDRIIDSQWITSSIYKSTVMNNEECFFGVNFADGRIKCYPTRKGKTYFIRYVRGNSYYGINKFVDNNDGTIADESTGFIWQKKDSAKTLNWEQALEYCEELELAGYSDWRLPNAKELQYIVDYSRSPDTTSYAAIDEVF
jgi:hypothetical protein